MPEVKSKQANEIETTNTDRVDRIEDKLKRTDNDPCRTIYSST